MQILVSIIFGCISALSAAQSSPQKPDLSFDSSVSKPAYTQKKPKVLFDEAHNNFHAMNNGYKPFLDLIKNDGYEVTLNDKPFTKESLKSYQILIIINARAPQPKTWEEALKPAFTEEENKVVVEWVRKGGSLLLIADHAPMGYNAESLSLKFGVEMSKGYTVDPEHPFIGQDGKEGGTILFSRENGLLGNHAIFNGRDEQEKIKTLVSFTGQSLKTSRKSVVLMKLGDKTVDVVPKLVKEEKDGKTSWKMENDPPISAAGRAQGLVFAEGKGKVVILGEAGMLTAQFIAPTEEEKKAGKKTRYFGMNRPGIDNKQFVLNLMHWLSDLLK